MPATPAAPRRRGRALRAVGRGLRGAVRWGLRWSAGDETGRRTPATVGMWLLAVAAAFVGFGTGATVYDVAVLGWGVMPFVGALAGLPLGLAPTRPVLGWAVSTGSAVALALTLPRVTGDPWPWLVVHGLVMLGLLMAVAIRAPLLQVAGAWVLTASVWAAGVAPDLRAGWTVAVTAVVVVGLLLRRLGQTGQALEAQTVASEVEKSRRVVLEERSRIARELHDVVAHHMSMVVVQAETAPYRVPDLSDAARAELTAIGGAAREALEQTRALLSVLRSEDDAAERAPQPGAGQAHELVAAARRAGMRLDAELEPDLGDLRASTSLTLYRVIQEGLANAARHSPGAAASVRLSRDGDRVEVDVTTAPVPGRLLTGPPVPGHGITGMRERVAADDGELRVGPTADGGFSVRASLPALTRVPGGSDGAP